MSLNLSGSAPSPYIDAVNDARFVRTFWIIAQLGSIFFFIGGAVSIGIGLAVSGFGSGSYYRALGLTVVVLAILGMFLGGFLFSPPIVLAAGVVWKGKTIFETLAQDRKDDPEWEVTRKRAQTGMILSGIGILISFGWLGLFLIGKAVSA
ncbi:MAG TPA: hypothetical protein VLB46_20985 [Pyrinomonadaceae bacterium]|nr:hypothetical protein [Pyrinomonadaceae bacterium]